MAETTGQYVTDKYWIFLEKLRRIGLVNAYCASPYLQVQFGISTTEANAILNEWTENYNPEDYPPETMEDVAEIKAILKELKEKGLGKLG